MMRVCLEGGGIPGGFADAHPSHNRGGESVCTKLRQRRGGPLPVFAAPPGGAPPPEQVWRHPALLFQLKMNFNQ